MTCNCNCHFGYREKSCMNCNCNRRSAKEIKKQIAKIMNNRKTRVSVALGDSDPDMDRIEIKYPKNADYISLNPITKILRKTGFYVAQIIDFYENDKRVVLLIRDRK